MPYFRAENTPYLWGNGAHVTKWNISQGRLIQKKKNLYFCLGKIPLGSQGRFLGIDTLGSLAPNTLWYEKILNIFL